MTAPGGSRVGPRLGSGAVLLTVLVVALLVSAVSVVAVKHRSRTLFIELRALERERDRLNVEWTQLALERSSWATHDRIEGLAAQHLGLRAPDADNMEVVTPR